MSIVSFLEPLGIVAAAIISITGAYISIRNRKGETAKVQSETSLNETQQAQIVQQLAESTEQMYIERIDSLKDDIRLFRDELGATRKELAEVRDEAGLLEEFFFEHHAPWDRIAASEIQKTNPDFPLPPSWLIFLRNKGKAKD
jgi:hypothetical protein